MHRRPPASEPEVPAELSLPHVPPREVSDFRRAAAGISDRAEGRTAGDWSQPSTQRPKRR